jgi:beta-galactosidase
MVPHWNWPADSIGKIIRVMVMSNADKIKLKLNGREVGEQRVDKYEMNTFKVPYHPGKLEAIAFKGNTQVATFEVETTGAPYRIELIPDRTSIKGDGWDALPVTVRVLDEKGRPVENANLPVTFKLSGPGDIIGLGNGDANSHEPEKGNRRSLYNGLAQVILQSREAGEGRLILSANSGNLKEGRAEIIVGKVPVIPFVNVVSPVLILDKWRISPVSKSLPDPNQTIADDNQNSWSPVKPGSLQQFDDGVYAIYRTTFTPFEAQRLSGGQIILKNILGRAQVYVDKKLVGTKDDDTPGDLTAPFPKGEGSREISVLIEAQKGAKAGLGGLVSIKTVN